MDEPAEAGEVRHVLTLDGKVIPFALEEEVRAHMAERDANKADVDAQLVVLRARVAADRSEYEANLASLQHCIELLQALVAVKEELCIALKRELREALGYSDDEETA